MSTLIQPCEGLDEPTGNGAHDTGHIFPLRGELLYARPSSVLERVLGPLAFINHWWVSRAARPA